MKAKKNIFLNKKILIYGLGKTGISAFKFLKNKSNVFLFDDYKLNKINSNLKKRLINIKQIHILKFDKIILSPGIDINKCKLSKFLKKNLDKIYSDLDVFYAFFDNDCITITGTNGKSTTCKLMYDILSNHKFDVKLAGNIGNPILSEKKIKRKTIFIIEASSYQLEYSKIFRSKYAAILNLSPDHIERHKTFKRYIKAKFKLLKNQLKNHYAFVNRNDLWISKELASNKFNCNIIKVDNRIIKKFEKKIDNSNFLNETNKENLSFVLTISKKFKLNKNSIVQTVQNFKGLNYRQQIILKRRKLTIINDSKSTSFSSSIGILKAYSNILWLLGGINKKRDQFNLPKKYHSNIRAFIYGKNKKFFNQKLEKKINYQNFNNLKDALKKVLTIVKEEKSLDKTILFSPSAASFDSFKNFEERGNYFNKLIKKSLNGL